MTALTLTQEELKALLDYDPDTGIFVWRFRTGARNSLNTQICGKRAGTLSNGYYKIQINWTVYKAHRVAFLWMTGRVPNVIDHVNLDRSDTRWANLREASHMLNKANVGRRSDNTSGFKGVRWHTQQKRWQARIQVNGKKIHLGTFDDINAAAAAYETAAIKHFGAFART